MEVILCEGECGYAVEAALDGEQSGVRQIS